MSKLLNDSKTKSAKKLPSYISYKHKFHLDIMKVTKWLGILVIFIFLLFAAYTTAWQEPTFPTGKNMRYTITQNADNGTTSIYYPYCLLTTTADNKITCSFVNYSVISEQSQALAFLNSLSFLKLEIPVTKTTKIFFDNNMISPEELPVLHIPETGIPTQVTITYKTKKPDISFKNLFIHLYYLLNPFKNQTKEIITTGVTITPLNTPQEYFKDASEKDLLTYIKTATKDLTQALYTNNLLNARSVVCDFNTCITQIDQTTQGATAVTNPTTILKAVNKTTAPADTVLQQYCLALLEDEYNLLPTPAFIPNQELGGIEAVDVFFMPNPLIDCEYKPPKIITSQKTIRQLAYAIYLNKTLSPFTVPTVVFSTTMPYLTNPAQNIKTVNYGIIFSPAGNLLLQKYISLISSE